VAGCPVAACRDASGAGRPLPVGAPGATLSGVEPPFLPHLLAAFEAANGRPLAQAATVSAAGRPEVRTVVLRALGADGAPSFATDARSAKMAPLGAGGWLELCLWRPDVGVQLRLLGRARVHRADDDRALTLWAALPLDTRALFFSDPPGLPLRDEATAQPPTPAPDDPPPAAFAVVRLAPERFDRLELGPPLRRRTWTLEGTFWRSAEVVP